MNKIVKKTQFSEKVFCLDIEAPLIARSCKPGDFIIVRVDSHSERVPYTIAKSDAAKGTLTLVVQEVGLSSTKLCKLPEGSYVQDVVGPLGTPSKIANYGTVVCAGGGIGIAAILPILTALKQAGNRVISVLAGRTKNLSEMRKSFRIRKEISLFVPRIGHGTKLHKSEYFPVLSRPFLMEKYRRAKLFPDQQH